MTDASAGWRVDRDMQWDRWDTDDDDESELREDIRLLYQGRQRTSHLLIILLVLVTAVRRSHPPPPAAAAPPSYVLSDTK
jgi:hypothetical protein